jgi:hypothetical protein
MSCIDLHKQFGYQSSIPEAVMVILSPSCKPDIGIYQLSMLGMRVVDRCEMHGEHEHDGFGIEELFVNLKEMGRDSYVSLRKARSGRRDVKIVAFK